MRAGDVANAHQWKIQAISFSGVRVNAAGAGTAVAGADHIGANDEILFRIKHLARPEQARPPVRNI